MSGWHFKALYRLLSISASRVCVLAVHVHVHAHVYVCVSVYVLAASMCVKSNEHHRHRPESLPSNMLDVVAQIANGMRHVAALVSHSHKHRPGIRTHTQTQAQTRAHTRIEHEQRGSIMHWKRVCFLCGALCSVAEKQWLTVAMAKRKCTRFCLQSAHSVAWKIQKAAPSTFPTRQLDSAHFSHRVHCVSSFLPSC